MKIPPRLKTILYNPGPGGTGFFSRKNIPHFLVVILLGIIAGRFVSDLMSRSVTAADLQAQWDMKKRNIEAFDKFINQELNDGTLRIDSYNSMQLKWPAGTGLKIFSVEVVVNPLPGNFDFILGESGDSKRVLRFSVADYSASSISNLFYHRIEGETPVGSRLLSDIPLKPFRNQRIAIEFEQGKDAISVGVDGILTGSWDNLRLGHGAFGIIAGFSEITVDEISISGELVRDGELVSFRMVESFENPFLSFPFRFLTAVISTMILILIWFITALSLSRITGIEPAARILRRDVITYFPFLFTLYPGLDRPAAFLWIVLLAFIGMKIWLILIYRDRIAAGISTVYVSSGGNYIREDIGKFFVGLNWKKLLVPGMIIGYWLMILPFFTSYITRIPPTDPPLLPMPELRDNRPPRADNLSNEPAAGFEGGGEQHEMRIPRTKVTRESGGGKQSNEFSLDTGAHWYFDMGVLSNLLVEGEILLEETGCLTEVAFRVLGGGDRAPREIPSWYSFLLSSDPEVPCQLVSVLDWAYERKKPDHEVFLTPGKWAVFRISAVGSTINASIDGKQVASMKSSALKRGNTGIFPIMGSVRLKNLSLDNLPLEIPVTKLLLFYLGPLAGVLLITALSTLAISWLVRLPPRIVLPFDLGTWFPLALAFMVGTFAPLSETLTDKVGHLFLVAAAAAFGFKWIFIAINKRTARMPGLFNILACLVFLLFVETYLKGHPISYNTFIRVSGYRVHDVPDRLGWYMVPRMRYTNRMLYDREFAERYRATKEPGTYRIICLGGSSTQGYGLERNSNQAYPEVLESILNSRKAGSRFQVMNAGVGGYSALHCLKMLEGGLVSYAPDMVTISVLVNNMPTQPKSDMERWEKIVAGNRGPLGKLADLFLDTHIGILMESELMPVLRGEVHAVSPEDYKEILRTFAAFCRNRGIRAAIIQEQIASYIFYYGDRENDEGFNRYYRRAVEVAGEFGVPLIDPYDRFVSERESAIFLDNVHMTPRGHEIMAQEIYRNLESKRYFD